MQLKGPQETRQSKKGKSKRHERKTLGEKEERDRGGSDWKERESRDMILQMPKKKKLMWGCHFLILASNALWRKFVKLHQGRLKLVYKGTGEGRRRRNVVHLRLLRCLQSAWLGGYSFFPFSVLLSCNERCKMPCFQTLRFSEDEKSGGKWREGERSWEWEWEETETFAFLFPWKADCEVQDFCLEGGGVHESSKNCFSSKKQRLHLCVSFIFPEMLCVLVLPSSSVNTDAWR